MQKVREPGCQKDRFRFQHQDKRWRIVYSFRRALGVQFQVGFFLSLSGKKPVRFFNIFLESSRL